MKKTRKKKKVVDPDLEELVGDTSDPKGQMDHSLKLYKKIAPFHRTFDDCLNILLQQEPDFMRVILNMFLFPYFMTKRTIKKILDLGLCDDQRAETLGAAIWLDCGVHKRYFTMKLEEAINKSDPSIFSQALLTIKNERSEIYPKCN